MRAPAATVARARGLRRSMTMPEVLLLQQLRGRPRGVRFRRQHPVGHFVLDFFCAPARLAVEIDGAVHDIPRQAELDQRRTGWLEQRGIFVRRIAATDVLANPPGIADSLAREAVARLPLHHPSDGPPPPQAGEEFR